MPSLINIWFLSPQDEKTHNVFFQYIEDIYFLGVNTKYISSRSVKISAFSLVRIRYFFTAEKYQFYSHLICIEFTACVKIN